MKVSQILWSTLVFQFVTPYLLITMYLALVTFLLIKMSVIIIAVVMFLVYLLAMVQIQKHAHLIYVSSTVFTIIMFHAYKYIVIISDQICSVVLVY